MDKCGTPKGAHNSPATEFKKGFTPWNKKEHIIKCCPVCGKIFDVRPYLADATFCSRPCAYKGRPKNGGYEKGHKPYWFGQPHSEETKRKISLIQRLHPRRGKDSPNYRGGGCQTERHSLMRRWEYKEWRKAVFERDNYTCQICGQHGGNLQADNVKPWWLYPELRFEISNGRTLCVSCHKKTDTWGHPARTVTREVCHV